jgi:class 3 adenylate cyclase/pimeloyl-ACP methyl ester carboxylesterase
MAGRASSMAEARAERRLAAILATDVVGYSRLMGGDEEGTLAALKSLRDSLIDQKIAEHRGRIVKTTGDGTLVEFASAVDAVRCAIDIQRALIERNAEIPEDRRIELRIGINVGDIIIEGEDIYGDGVNIAARLEGIAEAGGICISRQVFDQVEGKLQLAYRQMGSQNLKNIAKPIEVFSVAVDEAEGPSGQLKPSQEIKYCRTTDGVRLAYAISGKGPPLVKSANWMNHLEYDWESPVWRHVFRGLSSDHTLIRYDARGNGMSDWDVDELSLDAWVSDLETVVDAAQVERFPLIGISQGCAVAVSYAVRHPERVSHLVLYGGFALGGKRRAPEEKEKRNAMTTLMRLGWGADNASFRQNVYGTVHAECDARTGGFFQRTTTPHNVARMRCSLLRRSGGYRHHRSTRKGHREDARDACTRRPCLSNRGWAGAGRWHSGRQICCTAGPKSFIPGKRAGVAAVLRGTQVILGQLIGRQAQPGA